MAKPTRSSGNTRDDTQPPATFNRTERTLGFMVGGIILFTLICFVVMIVGWLTMKSIPGTGVWPVVLGVLYVGPPIALVLIITLLGVTWTKRARENRNAR
jgi:energy-coupling factor transporter transmembrane protein EcfT